MADSADTASRRAMKLASRHKAWREYAINWELYLMALLPVIWLIVFMYLPMYGNVIAFKRFVASLGIWGSPWIGFANFERFFSSFKFGNIMAPSTRAASYSSPGILDCRSSLRGVT